MKKEQKTSLRKPTYSMSTCRKHLSKFKNSTIFGSLMSFDVGCKSDFRNKKNGNDEQSSTELPRPLSTRSVSEFDLNSIDKNSPRSSPTSSTATSSSSSSRGQFKSNLRNAVTLSTSFSAQYNKNNCHDYAKNGTEKLKKSDHKYLSNTNSLKDLFKTSSLSSQNNRSVYDANKITLQPNLSEHYQKAFNNNNNKIQDVGYPFTQRSLSSTMLSHNDDKALKPSPSLWSICSKTSVKKMFSIFI